MPEITIDADKAERMIAEILRTEKRFLPADVNAMAANICRRLKLAMATPTNRPLHGHRLMWDWPPLRSARSWLTSTIVSRMSCGILFTSDAKICPAL
jgi:hypothetical protein